MNIFEKHLNFYKHPYSEQQHLLNFLNLSSKVSRICTTLCNEWMSLILTSVGLFRLRSLISWQVIVKGIFFLSKITAQTLSRVLQITSFKWLKKVLMIELSQSMKMDNTTLTAFIVNMPCACNERVCNNWS